jgi:hypothetical protein
MAYTRVSPGRWKDTKTGKIINSKTDPNKKAPPTKTPPTKDKPKPTPTDTGPAPEGPGGSKTIVPEERPTDIKELIPSGQFFSDLFTNNVTPRTVDSDGSIAGSTRAAMEAAVRDYGQSGMDNPVLANGLRALQDVFNTSGQAMGQEDQLLNQLTQGALNGFTPEELQVAREAGRTGITNQLQSAIRGSLGQAGNLGVFGRDVTRALLQPGEGGLNTLQSTGNAMAGLERDLFLNNIARKDKLAGEAITYGDTIRKRRFGEQLDSSGNLFQGANTVAENRLKAFENMFNSSLNGGNQLLNIQNTNNDNLNAFELGKVGAFTGGMGFADSSKTNKELVGLQRQALNSTSNVGRSGGSSGTSIPLATSARTFNQPGGPTNQNSSGSSASGSSFS